MIHLHIHLLQGSTHPCLFQDTYLHQAAAFVILWPLIRSPLDLEQEDSMTLKFSLSFISWGHQDGSDGKAFASLGTLV